MSKPAYKVLERFPEEVRREVAGRVFDREYRPFSFGSTHYVCADGVCVMGALMRAAGLPLVPVIDEDGNPGDFNPRIPDPDILANSLGIERAWELGTEGHELIRIIDLNDEGELATSDAVRALLLGEETTR